MSTTYDQYRPTLSDRAHWTLPHILSLRATTHRDAVYLDVPDAGQTYTFAEVHDIAVAVGSGLLARGHVQGDRVVIMLPNRAE